MLGKCHHLIGRLSLTLQRARTINLRLDDAAVSGTHTITNVIIDPTGSATPERGRRRANHICRDHATTTGSHTADRGLQRQHQPVSYPQ
jgi:hypothetical protein